MMCNDHKRSRVSRMVKRLFKTACAAFIGLASVTSANAALVDFTSEVQFNGAPLPLNNMPTQRFVVPEGGSIDVAISIRTEHLQGANGASVNIDADAGAASFTGITLPPTVVELGVTTINIVNGNQILAGGGFSKSIIDDAATGTGLGADETTELLLTAGVDIQAGAGTVINFNLSDGDNGCCGAPIGTSLWFPDSSQNGLVDPANISFGGVEVWVHARGDMNLDGQIDVDDINPFIQALSAAAAYESAFGLSGVVLGDFSGNGLVDVDDINPFIAALQGGGGGSFSASSIPEPATISLLAVGATALIRRRR